MTLIEKTLMRELGNALTTALRRIDELEAEIQRLQALSNNQESLSIDDENHDDDQIDDDADKLYRKFVGLCIEPRNGPKDSNEEWAEEGEDPDWQSPDTSILELSDSSSINSSHEEIENGDHIEESNNMLHNEQMAPATVIN